MKTYEGKVADHGGIPLSKSGNSVDFLVFRGYAFICKINGVSSSEYAAFLLALSCSNICVICKLRYTTFDKMCTYDIPSSSGGVGDQRDQLAAGS